MYGVKSPILDGTIYGVKRNNGSTLRVGLTGFVTWENGGTRTHSIGGIMGTH